MVWLCSWGPHQRFEKLPRQAESGPPKRQWRGVTPPPPFPSPPEHPRPNPPPLVPVPVPTSPQPATGDQATLVFRAIIRDENRNQLVHTGEAISVEVEVKNEGPGDAAGVEIVVSGGVAELVDQIPAVLQV